LQTVRHRKKILRYLEELFCSWVLNLPCRNYKIYFSFFIHKMQLLTQKRITSLELVEQINIFRKEECKVELGHNDLLKVIRDEFDDEISLGNISPSDYKSERGQTYPMFELTTSQAKQVLVRESKMVRKAVIAYIERLESKIVVVEPKAYTVKELLTMQLEMIYKLEESQKTVHILTHVNKSFTSTEIAKELNFKSAMDLNKKLHDLGIQFYQNGTWVLYSKYSGLAYIDIKQEVLDNGKIVYHRKWTGIGREFLLKLFAKI